MKELLKFLLKKFNAFMGMDVEELERENVFMAQEINDLNDELNRLYALNSEVEQRKEYYYSLCTRRKKINEKEKSILLDLKKQGYQWIVRCEVPFLCFEVEAFVEKPTKRESDWIGLNATKAEDGIELGKCLEDYEWLFPMVQWSDSEPTLIDDLLNVG